MPQHDIEITISKTGQVKAHIKGAKGKSCMDYAQWLANTIGNVTEQKLTSEYYEPDERNRIDLQQQLKEEA